MIRDPSDDRFHLHVFSHAADRSPGDIVKALRELESPRVRFASQYIGSFQAYAHVEVDALDEAMRLANELWGRGIRTETSSEVKISRINGPKRASPRYNALVRIRPDIGPFRLLDDLDDAFESRFDPDTYWYGAAVVTGRGYDLLVDLGRPTIEELAEAVLDDLRAVDGIGRTDTSWADLEENSFRRNAG
jgi:hypothetical protein